MNGVTTPKMFTPFTLGPIPLQHRVVMAPLTRLRSEQPGNIPGPLMAQYYEQRSSPGGLIITESAEITPEASAYEGAPGIYSEAQVAGWRKVTEAIHRKGGSVFLQLWHSGRVSHPDLTGVAPVSASATESSDILVFTKNGLLPAPRSRALETHELPGIVNLYRAAAARALLAGFDGVEVLAAGGYLLDQFLQDGTNRRTDAFGGSVENRSRLLFDREGAMEILDKGDVDLVAFGRHFIANPDLVERFRLGIPLNPYDRSTFYSSGPKGYLDYPAHTGALQELREIGK
jgi:N-ethylmaleimide reductase